MGFWIPERVRIPPTAPKEEKPPTSTGWRFFFCFQWIRGFSDVQISLLHERKFCGKKGISYKDVNKNVNKKSAEAAQAQKTAPTEGAEYGAVKPQNVEMPTVPLIELSTKDIPGVKGVLPQTGESLRKDAIARARNRLGLDQRSTAYIPASNVQRDGNEYVLKITRAYL